MSYKDNQEILKNKLCRLFVELRIHWYSVHPVPHPIQQLEVLMHEVVIHEPEKYTIDYLVDDNVIITDSKNQKEYKFFDLKTNPRRTYEIP